MVAQVLEALQPKSGGRYVDGTLGGGGHAEAVLRASAPDGFLYGSDRDRMAVAAATERLKGFSGRFEIRQGPFSGLADWVPEASCDGALLDLGVSSPQLDLAERGFSFQKDGPLDMRMDRDQPRSAADLVNGLSVEELGRIFWELGEERQARRIARAIGTDRQVRPIETTGQLAALVERVAPRGGQRLHPATRVFQALRMAVNDELGELKLGLVAVWKLVKPGGRLAVITFHSLEDRMVKQFGRELAQDYKIKGFVDVPLLRQPAAPQSRWVSRKPIQPLPEEVAENPRARSAHLRVMEKL
jgi:16S rRNA (cytosine1402-N4)-methyltransferase